MSKEYWYCVIGPIDREDVPWGGDFPMRSAVKDAFRDMLDEHAETCSSGWGVTEEDFKEMSDLMIKQFKRRNV